MKHLHTLNIIMHRVAPILPGNNRFLVVARFPVNYLFWKPDGNKFTMESKHHQCWLKYAPILHTINARHSEVSGHGKAVRQNGCWANSSKVARSSAPDSTAEWLQIYNMIGLEEKVAKFWRSLNPQIRQEMFRRDLDPDVDSWTVVVDGAVRAERVVNLESEPQAKSQKNRQNGNSSARKKGTSESRLIKVSWSWRAQRPEGSA
jgi:hypothetical protein